MIAVTALSEIPLRESNYFIVIVKVVSLRVVDVFLEHYLVMFVQTLLCVADGVVLSVEMVVKF